MLPLAHLPRDGGNLRSPRTRCVAERERKAMNAFGEEECKYRWVHIRFAVDFSVCTSLTRGPCAESVAPSPPAGRVAVTVGPDASQGDIREAGEQEKTAFPRHNEGGRLEIVGVTDARG